MSPHVWRRLLSSLLLCVVLTPVCIADDDILTPPDRAGLKDLEREAIKTIDSVMPATVAIRMERRNGPSATGVIISEDLILTAGHVTENPDRPVFIELYDGRRLTGTSLGLIYGRDIDLGLVKISEPDSDLPIIEFADSDDIQKGDWVLMLGHASLTKDSSENKNHPAARIGRVLRTTKTLLEVDAPFDSGDSGGPIVDMDGRLIGIVSRCGHQSWQNIATNIDAVITHLSDMKDATHDVRTESTRPSKRTPRSSKKTKRDPELRNQITHLTWEVSPLVMQVMQDNRLVCHGIAVADDMVLSKASTIARETRTPRIITGENQDLGFARVVAIDSELDLALLKVDEHFSPQFQWGETPSDAGRIMVFPRSNGQAPSIGIVQRDDDQIPLDSSDRPFIGIGFEPARNQPGLRVTRVVESSSAHHAQLRPQDIISKIDGIDITDRSILRKIINDSDVGDTLDISVLRNKEPIDIQLRIGIRPSGTIPSNTSTGTNRLTSGYGKVILNDVALKSYEVGMPAIDLNGKAVGMVIARRGRTATIVIPGDRVLRAVNTLLQQAQDPDPDLDERLCSYRIESTLSPQQDIELLAGDAFPVGENIRIERRNNGHATYGSWVTSDEALEWTIQLDTPGTFKVLMEYSCSRRNSGTPIRCSIGNESIDSFVKSTGSMITFETNPLGTIKVPTSGKHIVRLESLGSPGDELMRFWRLKLIRTNLDSD